MNPLPFVTVMSRVCDLVSALTEVSFLLFQKAVWPGGFAGCRACRQIGSRGCTPAWWPCLCHLGALGLGTLENRGTENIKDGCRGGGTLGSCGGCLSFGEKHPVPMPVKAGAELFWLQPCLVLPMPVGSSGPAALSVPSSATASSAAVRFLSWKGLCSRVTTTVQVWVWDGYSPHFFGKELTVNERGWVGGFDQLPMAGPG